MLGCSYLCLNLTHDALYDFICAGLRVRRLVEKAKDKDSNCALEASLGTEILAFGQESTEKTLESLACRVIIAVVGKGGQLLFTESVPLA